MSDIAVWEICLDHCPADAAFLSADERERAAKFRFDEDRRRFIAGRAALRAILASCEDLQPAEIGFRYNPHGKPAPAWETELRFNASHSGGLGLVAVAASAEIGVDIERIRDDIPWESIRARFLPDEEAADAEAFYRAWTRREAYVKALGSGMRALREPFRPGWSVRNIEVRQGWAAAVAVEGGERRIVRRAFMR